MKKKLPQIFNDFIREKEIVSRLSLETIRGYKQAFSTFQMLMPDIVSPQLLKTGMLIEFFSRLENRTRIVGGNIEKKGVKASTIKTYWNKLNSFFSWLEAKKHIEENPLKGITPPQPVYDDPRALSHEDINKIITAITLLIKRRRSSPRCPMKVNFLSLLISMNYFCG